MNNFQFTFFADIFSASILILLLISIITSKQYKYGSTKALICTMAFTLAAIIGDALNYYCEGKPGHETLHLAALSCTLLEVNIIETFVGVYINCYVNEHKKPGTLYTYRFSIITAIVEACCFLLTFILLITDNVFVIVNNSQAPGRLYLIPFILDAMASVFMIGYVLSHRQFLSRRDRLTIMTVVVFTAAGYLLDGLLQGYNFSIMFGLIAIMLNYLLVKDREVMDLRDEEDIRFRKRVQSVLQLSENFEIIFLVNLDNGRYKVAQLMPEQGMTQDFSGMEHFIEKNKDFIMKRVHPDDRQMVLDAISIEFLTGQFKIVPEYTVSYRLVKGGKEIWYKMRVRPEQSWPSRHKVLIGIFNNDAEYRKEREHELELEKQLERYGLVHSMMKSYSWSAFFDAKKKVNRRVYSDEIIRTFGYSATGPTSIDWKSIISPDALDEAMASLDAAISDKTGNTNFDIECKMRTKDDSIHWYHISARTLLNEDGSGELIGTFINTDAVHEKEELQTQRNMDYQFMQFRADILDYIATHDSDPEAFFNFFAGKILFASNADQIIYRKSDGYIMHKEATGVPDIQRELCDTCKLLRHTSQNAGSVAEFCINDCTTCDEDIRPPKACPVKSVLGRVLYNEGRPTGYLAIQDITKSHVFSDAERDAFYEIANIVSIGFERIKARETQQLDYERYRLVHDIVHSGMWSYRFNPQNEIYKTEYSDELLSIIGWDRDHWEENPDFFQQAIHPDDLGYSTEAFDACLHDKTCKTIFDSVYRMRNQEGEYHWFRSAGRVIRYQNGFGEFFGTHVNIDAEKKREELQTEIERARDNAESASAAKTAFLFNMSHDIRTPLNAIIGFTDMAITHKDEADKVGDYLNKVKTSSDFLLTIVNDVLDMSRIEAGKTTIEERVCDLIEATDRVAEINSMAAKEKNITFTLIKEDLPYKYLIGDVVHINQIVVNVLNNAMKYTPAGGSIWYTVREVPADTPDRITVNLTIKDNGIGMEPEFLTKIFDAFEREQTTTQSGIQGTGLGMSIVKRLTDLLGGKITIDSAPGEGTTVNLSFTHQIPSKEQIKEYEEEKKQKELAELKIDEEKLIGKKLLLVEDNELNREISEQILQERGLVIETAMDGLDALNHVKEKGVDYYDFVLMDIQMPLMDGYQATREIRKLPGAEKLPIAAFSANAFEEDRQRSIDAGMNIHVAKPINIKELTRSLASLL